MRIVAGRFRGRTLAGPKSNAIRPTSDRLRETIFNVLAHGYGDPVEGARVIDLFAGTGAMGIEALSRGAAFCLFVDEGAQARGLIRENVEALGLGGATRLFRRDATRMGAAGQNPPASLVVEEAQGSSVTLLFGFEEVERRDSGETTVLFARYVCGRPVRARRCLR